MPETETTTPDLPEIKTCEEYMQRHQQDFVLWKADRLLAGLDNPVKRNECFEKLAYTISLVQQPIAREDYAVKIGKKYGVQPAVFKKMIAEAIEVRKRQAEIKKTVRKNKVLKLEGNANVYPFFSEILDKEENFKEIRVNKVKFVELLRSFGYARYEVNENDDPTFVRIQDNIIKVVKRAEIIDHIEHFINKEYNFEGADIQHVTSEMLLNKLYDGMRTFFSKDLFARVKSDEPIIISRDKSTITYLYFKNGFVEITDQGYELKKYEELDGSVWDHQVMDRDFTKLPEAANVVDQGIDKDQKNYDSDFADFCWKISGRDANRFTSLCCIIGYLVHDFYNYVLKMIYFTDSTVSDSAQGRTGKTLLMRLIGKVRSFAEIPGKQFNPSDERRYQLVKLGTQIVHINDVSNKGRYKFEVEPMFNDITDGLSVRALYLPPFVQYSKLAVSGNGSLLVSGDSAMDRILEFEVSNFFSPRRRPVDYYGRRLADDWDAEEWNRFDNFICFCCKLFHQLGLQEPPTINLRERKLRDHTTAEFLEFMSDRVDARRAENNAVLEFNVKELYDDFKAQYSDFNNQRFTQHRFNKWLTLLGDLRFEGKFRTYRSNGIKFINYG